jgi:hypothetical protein
METASIGVWRVRARVGVGLSIMVAAAGLQLVQWLHATICG